MRVKRYFGNNCWSALENNNVVIYEKVMRKIMSPSQRFGGFLLLILIRKIIFGLDESMVQYLMQHGERVKHKLHKSSRIKFI